MSRRQIVIAAVTAVAALTACSSAAAQHAPEVPARTHATAPASNPVPLTQSNIALCKIVRLQLQIDAADPVTADQAGLIILNDTLQDGVSSPGLVADVTGWALALSTDLSAGQTTSAGTASALRKVAQDCAAIGVSLP